MKKEPYSLKHPKKSIDELMKNNAAAINECNGKTLSALLFMGWLLVLLPLAAAPISTTKDMAIPAYIITFAAFFCLFFLFKLPSLKKHACLGLYAAYSFTYIFDIYLSVFHSPDMRATILLITFGVLPVCIIDHPRRTMPFLIFWLAVHAVLSFYFKPYFALDDLINCICALSLGCYIGITMMRVRLESFEVNRLLVIEKETDVLTGLFNRRKLFETLTILETTDAEKPTGILMIDIDNFKMFNDRYGHGAGDKCLYHFGEVLKTFMRDFRIHFYRYGGEEFVAMAYGYDEKELYSIAESLRLAVRGADMDGHFATVSIGVAYCGGEQILNYENIFDRADKAAYSAKAEGRDRVCMEQLIKLPILQKPKDATGSAWSSS